MLGGRTLPATHKAVGDKVAAHMQTCAHARSSSLDNTNTRACTQTCACAYGARAPRAQAHRFGGEAAVRRSRELAAIQAQREVERMKLEDQRKKIEAVCATGRVWCART